MEFFKALLRLLPALTIVDGRIHIPITVDAQDFDGTQIYIVPKNDPVDPVV